MARLGNDGSISGGLGNSNYSKRKDGTTVIRLNPGKGKVKQTVPTKNSSKEFSDANRLAKLFSAMLFPIIQQKNDGRLYRRFVSRIRIAGIAGSTLPIGGRTLLTGTPSLLEGLPLNITSLYEDYCSVVADLDYDSEQLTITVPGFDAKQLIAAPVMASHFELQYLVTAVDIKTGDMSYNDLFRLAASDSDTAIAAQQWTTPALVPGQLVVVTAAIVFIRKNNLAGDIVLNDKTLHPGEVIGVFTS